MADMGGEQLIDILCNEFGIHIEPATKSQWKKKVKLTSTVVRNALHKFEFQKLARAIVPIMEIHELKKDHGKNVDSFRRRISNGGLVDTASKAVGIYSFYDAQGRLIYTGKTEKNNLFKEMEQRYGNKWIKFKRLKNGKASPTSVRIRDLASFVSAYKVEKHLIKNVEALMTRTIINNASNLRIESFSKSAQR